MSIRSKPDPIGVDASCLLEGQNSLVESVNSAGVSTASVSVSTPLPTLEPTRDVPVTTPYSPKRPPGSVVGGFGLPKLSTIWTAPGTGVMIIQSVDFTVLQKGMEYYLRFLVLRRPSCLAPFITEHEWKELRERVDEIGVRVRWDANRSLILLVVLFVMVVVVNTGDEIGGGFALNDVQVSVLVFLGVILLKLLWDECCENFTRRAVLHEMDEVCRQYSDIMRPRGACVAFRFVDNDDYGLLVDLTFYRVQTKEEAQLNIT